MSTTMVRRRITPDWASRFMMQQIGHGHGAALVFDATDHICAVKDQAGNDTIAKAIKSSSSGNIEIHLVDDWDANGNAVWYVYALVGGEGPDGLLFDYVRETNTTVTLADVEFIL
jgi:hypothetical protein